MKKMNAEYIVALLLMIFLGYGKVLGQLSTQDIVTLPLYAAPPQGVETRWITPENPTGEKGKGGMTNKGAKGEAFYIIAPGEKKVIMDIKGAGIINRMWVSGTLANNAAQRRAVRIDIYWDEAQKPAVSAPFGDFFGVAHGLMARMDNQLFQSPEARSFNFTIPMPFRKSAYMTLTNESDEEVWLWYDINYQKMNKIPDNALYFHTSWRRDLKTTAGTDFEILPFVKGKGRYLGTNVGVLGDTIYAGTWFGEGEVKVYLDGDNEYPTLVGTGTEDYVGTGWGQGAFSGRYFGSPIASKQGMSGKAPDMYAFYRYHIDDPVFFHKDCKVTIQQMGNTERDNLRRIIKSGSAAIPVWLVDIRKKPSVHRHLLTKDKDMSVFDDTFPEGGINFYRSDDVCATAYFYLDKPQNDLPELPSLDIRLKKLKGRVWN